MKRINNKGYMLVEIILASVLSMVVAYFVIDLTIKLKNKNDDLLVKTLVSTDQAIIYNTIYKDLKTQESVDCDYVKNKINIDKENKTFTYGDFTTVISDYATIGDYSCEIDENSINLNIPLEVKQLSDDEFDIIVSNVGSDVSDCTLVKSNCKYLYYNGLTYSEMTTELGADNVINPGKWASYEIANQSALCSGIIFKNRKSLGYLEISSSATKNTCWGRIMGWSEKKISLKGYNILGVVYKASQSKVASATKTDLKTKVSVHTDQYYNAAGSGTGNYKVQTSLKGNTDDNYVCFEKDISNLSGSYFIGFVNDQTNVDSSSQQSTYIYQIMLCE